MSDASKEVLLNLFFVLSALLVVPILLEERKVSRRSKTVLTTIATALSIILCMTFPVRINNEFIYDLRQIPIWIGGLYGGPLSAFFLCIVTITYRMTLGGTDGIIVTTIVSIFQAFICIFFSKKFKYLSSPKQRIFWVTTLSTFSASLTILIGGYWLRYEEKIGDMVVTYLPAQPLGAFLASYITESLRRNAELRQRVIRAEKMEVVGHLAASISHEIRNPLTVSRGFMQLLAQSKDTSEKNKQYIQIAIEELDRAEAIITDYLTFAKPAPEREEKLNVKTEIERVIDVLRPLANMSSVEIQTTLVPFAIKGERQKFQQCLLNVMKNAIEAMPNGGTLYVNVSIEKDYVSIHIADTGVGMTKEQIERLGEPYFTTKGAKGTGLGMMVVYRIIETMNGIISVHSEVDKGTDVYIYLPSFYADQMDKAIIQNKRALII
ncbi:ATP-binding protein [Thermolongibacillus altinsuensis]